MGYHSIHMRGGEFFYFDWGGYGPLVHISHSIGLCAGVYTPFALRLTKKFKVIGLDGRGHGRAKAPADPGRLKNWNVLYDDLEQFFERFDQPLIAVGHSMGGSLSLAVAVRRPDLVRALVLIEPGIMPPSWRWGVFFLQLFKMTPIVPLVSRTAQRRCAWPSRKDMKDDLFKKRSYCSWRPDFLEAYMAHATEEIEAGSVRLRCDPAWESRCIATAPTGIWRYVSRVKIPTLILYGERSKTFLPQVAARFEAKLPHAVLRRFAGTGHNLIMEKPDAVAEAVFDFLGAQVPNSPILPQF